MENPDEWVGKSTRDKEAIWNLKSHLPSLLRFSRVVDHIESRHNVVVKWRRMVLWVANVKKDSTEIFSGARHPHRQYQSNSA